MARRCKVLLFDYAELWQKHQRHQKPSSEGPDRRQVQELHHPHIREPGPRLRSAGGHSGDGGDWAETPEPSTETPAPSTLKVTYGYLVSMYKAAVLFHVVGPSPCVGMNLPAVVDVAVVPLATEKVQERADRIWKPYKPMGCPAAPPGFGPRK